MSDSFTITSVLMSIMLLLFLIYWRLGYILEVLKKGDVPADGKNGIVPAREKHL